MSPDITRRDLGRISAAAVAGASRLRAADKGAVAIDETLRSASRRRGIPAVVAMVARGGSLLYSGAFGTRDVDSGIPVDINSVFSIASMTKAITTTAVLQLVEQGKLKLDQPAARHLPELAKLRVIAGFDEASGEPLLEPASKPVTLRHLLTHTSGFSYTTWNEKMFRYAQKTGTLNADSITDPPSPLVFQPGSGWQYGTGLDWAGRIVEVASGKSLEQYFQENILQPLAMKDTSYFMTPGRFDRFVASYQRSPDGTMVQSPRVKPNPPARPTGGGGLYSTAPDYIRFTQMILGRGSRKMEKGGVAKILKPETIAQMSRNQIGPLGAGKLPTFIPEDSAPVDMHPGAQDKWGLGFLINTVGYEGGRSPGSLAWAGFRNTYYWIDPHRDLSAVILMQFIPFADQEAVGLLSDFERSVYANFKSRVWPIQT